MRSPPIAAICLFASAVAAHAQSIAQPWSGHQHDAQHTGISAYPSQPMQRIRWRAPVDLAPEYSGQSLYAHYSVPIITRQNTVIFPVKTGASDGFRIEARDAADGSLKWSHTSDYTLPPYSWLPVCGTALTPKNRVYFPGAGGTVYFRDAPDAANAPPSANGQFAFYGMANYLANTAAFNANVRISTPFVVDRYGNLFFGFVVSGPTAPALQSGFARIAEDGSGAWVGASAAAGDPTITKPAMGCAPGLSNDHRTLYVAVNSGNFTGGWLLALDSRTLATVGSVRLKDVRNSGNDALISDTSTSSPMIGPDGDVFFGVLESPLGSNRYRGWLLHFDSTLGQAKIPGAFGWDDTPSLVPSALVPQYAGASPYLILSKYNSYVEGGGGGSNKLAILDPNDSMADPANGATVMKEVLTKLGPTADPRFPNIPTAVREWCINAAAVDPFTRSAIVHSEDGRVYRWDFPSDTLSEHLPLTNGIGEAYIPTGIGPDGTAYVIANATLFAIGK